MTKYPLVAAFALFAACSDPEPAVMIDPARSSFTLDRSVAHVGVDVVAVMIEIRDANGQPIAGVPTHLTASGSDNILTQPAPTDANGDTSATWSATLAETKTLAATLDDGTSLGELPVEFLPGPPAQLRFAQQPTTAEAGGPIPFAVALADEYGNQTTATSPAVSVALAVNPSGAALDGTTMVQPGQGVAMFADVNIDEVATGYVLRATATDLSSVDSEPFDITAGDPSSQRSSLTIMPSSLAADGVATAAIRVTLANQYNIPIAAQAISLVASGTNNVITPASGVSDANGRFIASWSSTMQGTKTLTATAGSLVLTANATFYGPPCTLQFPGRAYSPLDDSATAFALADVDADGHPDAIIAEPTSNKLTVRRGNASGTFAASIDTPLTGNVVWLATGDLDGNGTLDVVAAVSDATNALVLLGDGTGHFAAPTTRALPAAADSLALADFTRDGTLDLATALPSTNQVLVYPGVGNGTFGAAVATLTTPAYPAYLNTADLNGDGYLDLATSNLNDLSLAAFLSTGPGTFGSQIRTYTTEQERLVLADVNHDSIPDAVAFDSGGTELRVRIGNGTGQFNLAQTIETYPSHGSAGYAGVVVADFTGDGHPDVVVGRSPDVVLVPGNGNGTFGPVSRYSGNAFGAIGGLGGGLAAADIDGDMRVDLVLVAVAVGTARNLGNGAFALPRIAAPEEVLMSTSADFNGDGVPDLAGHHPALPLSGGLAALLSTSTGALTRVSSPFGPSQQADGDAADIDEDGKQDLVVFDGLMARPLLGLGTGAFQAGTTVSTPYSNHGLLRDVNNDGHADMLVMAGGGVHVKLGTGTGTFSAGMLYSTTAQTTHVLAVDVDNDGDRDLIISTRSSIDVRRNAGTGSFGFADSYPSALPVSAIAAGDFNGDGRLDIAYLESRVVHVLQGQMNGTFMARPETYVLTPYPYFYGSQMEAGDIDGSGTLDLVMSTTNGFFVLQGLGNGAFAAPVHLGFGGAANLTSEIAFVLGDRNADGRLDLTFTNPGGSAMALQGACIP